MSGQHFLTFFLRVPLSVANKMTPELLQQYAFTILSITAFVLEQKKKTGNKISRSTAKWQLEITSCNAVNNYASSNS